MTFTEFMAKMDAHKRAGSKVTSYKHGDKESSYTVLTPQGTVSEITHTDSGGVKVTHKKLEKEKGKTK